MGHEDELVRLRVEGVTPPLDFWPEPVDGGPEGALRTVITTFEQHAYACSATAWVTAEDGESGSALVFRCPRGRLLVIRSGKLADYFRTVLADGFAGWHLQPLPTTRTLLEIAESTLGHRAYNMLTRAGFVTVEELAAAPELGLMDLRNIGPKSLAAIRAAIAEHSIDSVTHPSVGATRDARREYIAAALSRVCKARNSEFLEALAHSSVPMEAVDAILTSLSAEPVSPVDTTIALLLRTAAEPGLATLYAQSRQP